MKNDTFTIDATETVMRHDSQDETGVQTMMKDAFIPVKKKMGAPTTYKPEYCEDIVEWFADGMREILEPERVVNKIQDVKYVTKPIFPRTIGGWACTIGTHRATLNKWAEAHIDFSDALKTAKDIQEQCAAMMTATGAWTPSFGIFMLKNCAGWTDRVDVTLDAQVTLAFDKADEEV